MLLFPFHISNVCVLYGLPAELPVSVSAVTSVWPPQHQKLPDNWYWSGVFRRGSRLFRWGRGSGRSGDALECWRESGTLWKDSGMFMWWNQNVPEEGGWSILQDVCVDAQSSSLWLPKKGGGAASWAAGLCCRCLKTFCLSSFRSAGVLECLG